MKRFRRYFWYLLATLAALYVCDEILARVRGHGSIEVEMFYAVTRKDNRIDYMRSDPQMEECVNSLLPHTGLRPCWYVARNPRKEVEVGIQRNDFWRH